MPSVNARVRVEIEIPVAAWNEASTFASLHEQVKREGIQIIENLIREKGGRVVGTPVFLASMYEEKSHG